MLCYASRMKEKIKYLPWKIVVLLALFALLRPVNKMLGSLIGFEIPSELAYVFTGIIAVTWITVALWRNIKAPIWVLGFAGGLYAILSVTIAASMYYLFPENQGETSLISLLTIGLLFSVLFNVLWGGFLGYITSIIQRIMETRVSK